MKRDHAKYHYQAEKGWINDPNGLCYFRGRYHAFNQHNPHKPVWGPMHWGHAVSEDLINWQELPIALYPDMPYEKDEKGGGCFSGSAIEKDGVLYLMYTSVSTERGQTQSIVTTADGVNFEKYPGNPVIAESPLDPENRDFRDPKVFEYGGSYRMVCGAGVGEKGYVLLYSSEDLLNWEYEGQLYESDKYKGCLECPDFYPLGDKWVLKFSRMDSFTEQFVVGTFDGKSFTPEFLTQPELGPCFYADQSFLDKDGRRIVMGWMYDRNRKLSDEDTFMGSLSVPREVSLKDGKLRLYPVKEAWHLLKDGDPCVVREDGMLKVMRGDEALFSACEKDVTDVKILADADLREVFINKGETNIVFEV